MNLIIGNIYRNVKVPNDFFVGIMNKVKWVMGHDN